MSKKLENKYKLQCPECGADMALREYKYGPFYGCTEWPRCKGAHGAHPDGRPLGIPANKETKELRIKVHAIFDKLWPEIKDRAECSKSTAKNESYKWLANFMGMTRKEAHIGRFTADECRTFLKRAEKIDINDIAVRLAIKLI